MFIDTPMVGGMCSMLSRYYISVADSVQADKIPRPDPFVHRDFYLCIVIIQGRFQGAKPKPEHRGLPYPEGHASKGDEAKQGDESHESHERAQCQDSQKDHGDKHPSDSHRRCRGNGLREPHHQKVHAHDRGTRPEGWHVALGRVGGDLGASERPDERYC